MNICNPSSSTNTFHKEKKNLGNLDISFFVFVFCYNISKKQIRKREREDDVEGILHEQGSWIEH